MSITEEIQRLQQAKASIKQAIETHGVNILESVKLDEYYTYINALYTSAYNAGRTAGYSEGHEAGYSEGHTAGYSAGYQDGYADGQAAGGGDSSSSSEAPSSSSEEPSSSSEEPSSSSEESSSSEITTVTLSGTDYGLDGTYNWDSTENAYVNGNYKIFWDTEVPEWAIKTVDEQMTYYELYSPSLVGNRSEILGTQEWTDFIGGMTTASLTITAGGGADAEAVQRASNVYGDGVSRRVTGDTEEELRHSALINNDEE